MDGSGLRTLLTFADRSNSSSSSYRQCLVLCGNGMSRQSHIASGIALYKHAVTKLLVPSQNIVLASSGVCYAEAFRGLIERAAADDDAAWKEGQRTVLGFTAKSAGADGSGLLNALLIVQNPKDLADVFGAEGISVATVQKGCAVQGTDWLYVAYIKVGNRLVRTFVPKVGGNGLYGVTCGDFLSAYFHARVSGVKSPHVLFNGTAGGFANSGRQKEFLARGINGLGDVKPGGIIIPTKSITSWSIEKKSTRMRTIVPADVPGSELGSGLIRAMEGTIDKAKMVEIRRLLNFTDNHAAVTAPALETYEFIDELVAAGHASVDVEGAPTNEALDRVVVSGTEPRATFTPIYTHSDDPRASTRDFYDSLAQMGPFFEGSRPLSALLEVVKFMFEHSVRHA